MRAESVYKKYRDSLRGYIAKRLPSLADVDDMVQDVFCKFVIADSNDPITSIASWLYRVAENSIIDRSRKKKPEPLPYKMEDNGTDELETVITDIFLDNEPLPDDELMRGVIMDEIEQALSELPSEQRKVFELNELQGIPFKEISEATSIPINTLITRKRYAVTYLRKRLATLYDSIKK